VYTVAAIRGVKGASFYSTTIFGGGSAFVEIRSPRSCRGADGAGKNATSRRYPQLTVESVVQTGAGDVGAEGMAGPIVLIIARLALGRKAGERAPRRRAVDYSGR
jgi:hypothetical protein